MSLIPCPYCGKQVADQPSGVCPHCGGKYNVQDTTPTFPWLQGTESVREGKVIKWSMVFILCVAVAIAVIVAIREWF